MTDWRSRATPLDQRKLGAQPIELASLEQPAMVPTPKSPMNPSQAAAAMDWKSRARPITQSDPKTDWKSRAKPLNATNNDPNFLQRVGADYENRNAQMQQATDAFVAGEQGAASTAYQQGAAYASKATDTIGEALRSITPEPVKKVAGAVADAVGNVAKYTVGQLPVPGREGNLAEELPKDLATIGEGKTELTRNLRATGQILNMVPAAGAVDVAAQLGSKTIKKVAGSELAQNYVKSGQSTRALGLEKAATKTAQKEAAGNMKQAAGESYDEAAYLGAQFKPDQLGDKLDVELKRLKPTPLANGKLTSEAETLNKHLKEFEGHGGKAMTLEQFQNMDKSIGQKITANFIDPRTGLPDANGLQLMKLQQRLRKFADEADTAGNDALTNGREFWKGQAMLNDLDAIAERASLTKNAGESLRNGYKNLYLDKDRIAGWPQEVKDMLHKAAEPTMTDEALDFFSTRLPAAIGLGTGNIAGAATAQVAGMAARGAKEAIVAKRGARVQQSIVDNVNKKIRPVDIPEPKVNIPLQLAAPGKLSPLPMSDAQVNIAQKLMHREPKIIEESGVAVKPPVSQLTKLKDSLGRKRGKEFQDTVQIFKDGDMSQNQFVKDVKSKFGLTEKQARDLAKEINTYGE